jgi:hypothetical protein
MTFEERIDEFISKALTRGRDISTLLENEYDPRGGYQSIKSVEYQDQLSSVYAFFLLLRSDDRNEYLTDVQYKKLIEFYYDYLELEPVAVRVYTPNYIPVGYRSNPNSEIYVSLSVYNAAIASLQAADTALQNAINDLNDQINALLPLDFFDNYVASYAVVFDDDVRLHTHANKSDLDELNSSDITNIKALTDHFNSVGEPGGQHLSPEDRVKLNAIPDGGSTTYDGQSPTTLAVGGMPSGTVLTGRTLVSILEEILVDYLLPSFSSFASADIPSIEEVGVTISGFKNFTWGTTNPGNVSANTIYIKFLDTDTFILSASANDGAESVDVGTINNPVPVLRQWRPRLTATNAANIDGPIKSMNVIYPYFYGKASGSKPTGDQALINGGTKVKNVSSGTLVIPFNSIASEFLWFAHPASETTKTKWYVTEINQGAIGGSISPGGNLFPDPITVSINSPSALWSSINFKIYISNYPTELATVQLIN